MKYFFHSIPIALLVLCTLGCSKNDDQEVAPQERDDCQMYEPSSIGNSLEAQWKYAGDIQSFPNELPVIQDPAGGVFTISVDAPESAPWIRVWGAHDLTIVNGGNPLAPDVTTRKVSFLAHPGERYGFELSTWFPGPNLPSAPGEPGSPENFTITWAYSGILDCYESNNSFDEAKFIPKNQVIQAMANVNNVTDANGNFIEYEDNYKFTIQKPTQIKFELTDTPSDMQLNARIYNDNKDFLIPEETVYTNQDESLYYLTMHLLNPGTYYIRIFPNDIYGKSAADLDKENKHDSWGNPYKFKISTTP